jgi:stage II sporulation protein R
MIKGKDIFMCRYQRILTGGIILLCLLGLFSVLPIHGEQEIYDSVVRLHVLANSDTDEDQALKLKVRDAVLDAASPVVEGCRSQAEAIRALNAHLSELEAAARRVIASEGRTDSVTVLLGEEDYPTRTYESCAFPAGRYVSLRVCIGEAKGQNWWC